MRLARWPAGASGCGAAGLKLALLTATASLVLSCGRKSAPKPAMYFPEAGEVTGWNKVGETRTFEAKELWRYLDGDAERYVHAGVQRTLTADYRYRNETDAAADIHIMAAPDGARKIFESEPAGESEGVGLGDAGRLYGASLVFRKGAYLVRLVAYRDTPQVRQALVELSKAIEKRLR